MKPIYFFIFLLSANNLSAQKDSTVALNYLIATGIEDFSLFCHEPVKAKLFLNDSTLIGFNESSTFERRLNLSEAPLLLKPGNYKVVLMNDANEILKEQPFNTDAISSKGQLIVAFDFERCCMKLVGKFLFFEMNTVKVVNKNCDNIEATLERLKLHKGTIIITGIVKDSSDYEIATKRIEFIKNTLGEHGIVESRFITKFSRESTKYPFSGSSSVLYPKEEDCLFENQCELGIVIELAE